MHGSRSRHVGGHPSEWSPTEHLYQATGGRGPLHGGYPAPSPGYYPYQQRPEQLSPFQEPPPVPGYFGAPGPGPADPYQPDIISPNVALQVFVDACNHMAQSSIPVGPPRSSLGGPPVSPYPLEQRSFHGPLETGRPPPPPLSDIVRGRWGDRSDVPFRDLHHDDPRRDFIDRRHLPPPPSDARNGAFHHEDNPIHWSDAPALLGHGSESRGDQHQQEYRESSRRGRSAERGNRERGGRGYDTTYGGSHHRSSRARSPKPDKSVKDRLGPTPSSAEGRHLRGAQREARPPPPDVEIIEHLSTHARPSSILSQSRGRHSSPPPPVHHHPPEHRQRLEEGFNPPFTVNDRLGPPPPSRPPPAVPSQQPVPLFTPLADRLGGSPDSMARSVQARLGPPRITEPLDHNQGLVPFNTAGPAPLLATRSEPLSPLPDLRRELESYNPLSRSLQSPPPHLSSGPSGSVPLFGRSHSPSQRTMSPIRDSDLTSPNRRGPLSPIRGPSVSGRQPLSPTAAPTPRSRPPSPSKRPQLATSSPSRHHSSPTKHLQSPRIRSPSPGQQHPSSFSSRPISPAKHTTEHAQLPTSNLSKPLLLRGGVGEEEEQPSRSRHCSRYFSPPLSPVPGSTTRTKKHHTSSGDGDDGSSRHSISSPPPSPPPPLTTSSSATRHTRRSSSGKIKSPPSNSGIKKRTPSSPRQKSHRSPSPSTKKRSSSGKDTSSLSPSSSRRRSSSSRAKSPRSQTKTKSSLSRQGESSSEKQPQLSLGPSKRKSSSAERSSKKMPSHNDDLTTMPTSSRVHPLHRRQSASSADRMGAAKSKIDSVPLPGPSANRFLPPAPVRSSSNDPSPGPPPPPPGGGGGKSRGLLSHDLHRQEAAGEFKSSVGPGENRQKQAPSDTGTSSPHSSSPSPSIPPLMDFSFRKRISSQEQSLSASSDSTCMSKAPSSRTSSTISPTEGSSVMNLENLNSSKSADIVSLPLLSGVPRDPAFTPPLSQPEKNSLPFFGFFETDTPQPAVGVSDSYLSGGQKSSPRTKEIVIRSSESSDTLCPDVNTDSDNEGGLVIDESFVSQNGNEASPEKDKSIRESEKLSKVGLSFSSSITNFRDIIERKEPPSSPDCEILSVSTVDSISSSTSSQSGKALRSNTTTRGHRLTPESTSSGSERSKSSVLASLSARHRSIMPAAQRAKKLASSAIGSEFVKKLLEGDEMEQDLLRRFFKAVVLVTERLKWKYKSKPATPIFASYYKKVFHGFLTGSLNQRLNVPTDLCKQELKALKEKCGPCVSKWKEQLQRYILRAGTLPKEKKDLDAFVKNQKTLMESVEATKVIRLSSASDADGDRPVDPRIAKPHPSAPPTATATVQKIAHPSPNSIDPRKDKPHPPAPPTNTVQPKSHVSSDSDGPSDSHKARPLPLPPHSKALRPSSAFTPVISTPSPPSNHSSSKLSDSRAKLATSPKKPITLLHGQSTHIESSCTFKPLRGTPSESYEKEGGSLFTVDRSADYSLDPELEAGRGPDGFRSSSTSSSTSTWTAPSISEAMVEIDLAGEDLADPYMCPPQMSSDRADEEPSLAGEKVTMDVVLSGAKERSETIPTIADQPGPSNVVAEEATSDSVGTKDDLGSSSKLDTTSERQVSGVDLTATTSESYDSTTETEDGEIISPTPSPAPSPPPEKQTAPLPVVHSDPGRWRGFDSQERELSQQRHRHWSYRTRSPCSRSSSPQRRGSSPDRFYRRRRYRSRSRSRDRTLRSHDRRRRSVSRDRRSRSHDRRSRDRRYRRSRTRSKSRGKSRSPARRSHSQKSNATERAQRRASRSKDGKGSTDSEDELEILKREALASMKQMTAGDAVKSTSTQEECLRDGVENDYVSERGEADMDLCSQCSEGERGGGEGEADMELCSESSSGEGDEEEVSSIDEGRRETGKMDDGRSQGNVAGDSSNVIVDDNNGIEVTFGKPVNASATQSEAAWKNQQTDGRLELSEEDFIVDYDVAARPQDKPSTADTLTFLAEKEKSNNQSSTTVPATHIPAQTLPATTVGRSVSAPSRARGDKPPTATMKQSLPSATTGEQSVPTSESSNQSPAAPSSSQSSAVIMTSSEPSASKPSQSSTTKNSQPSSVTEKPPSAIPTRSKSSDIPSKTAQPSSLTQPSLFKTSTSKTTTNQPPVATKAVTGSVPASSQQTAVASTKARQPSSTAKATQVKTSQPPSVKASSVKSSQSALGKASQPSSSGQKAGQAAGSKTVQTQGLSSKVADSGAVKSLKKSLSRSSSRSGSKANSPCLSPTHAPSPSGSTDSQGVGGAVGGVSSSDIRVRHRSGSCVKVLPSNKATWDIPRFLIINTSDMENDSETDSSSSESDGEETTPPTTSPELSEISKLLLKAKQAAEENAQIEDQRKAQEESLNLPAPPSSLTAAQKKEYLELQRKLALHAKKKALGATTKAPSLAQISSGSGKAQQLAGSMPKSGQNSKDKLAAKKGGSKGLPLKKKPVSTQVAAVKGKIRSNSEPSILPTIERKRKAESSGGGGAGERVRNNTGLPQGGQVIGQKGEESRTRGPVTLQRQVDQEERQRNEEIKKKICEMEGTVQEHKSTIDKCQGELTTLTHQLTDTVSEIEELELKMENLRKALKAAEIAHGEAEQRRCELQDKVRDMKKTIATTNSSIEQLEKDINSLKSTPSSSQGSLRPPPPVSTGMAAIDDAEPDASDVTTRSQQSLSDLLRLEHNYCNFESSTAHQEDTPSDASIPPYMETLSAPASPLVSSFVEVETSEEPPGPVSREEEDSVCIVEQVTVTEVPQVLVYDIADQTEEPEVDISPPSSRHTLSLLPKKTFKKRAEPPTPPLPRKDKPSSSSGRRRRPRKRRASTTHGRTPSAKRRPRDIQLLQRQASLPASLDMQSPLGSALSQAINTALCPALSSIVSPDGYSSLTRSFQLPEVVVQSRPPHSSSSSVPNTPSSSTSAAANSVTHCLQNGFSSDNRVPEILTDLVTSLNTETLTSPPHSTSTARLARGSQREERGGDRGVNNDRVTGILSDLVTSLNTETMAQAGVTSPPPISSQQRFPSNSRGGVSGIVNNLVTYLTSETINASFSADSANVSAISRTEEGMDVEIAMQQHAMEVEVHSSPFSPLPTDSEEVNTLTSGCEASEEYESEEEERVRGRRERIDADSLFHPGSDFLFTLGPEEPPLFILPRLACAGDFPLEIDPAAVSSVALDVARQGIIHATQSSSSDLSSDVTESELTELSEFSDRAPGVGCHGDGVAGTDEGVQVQSVTSTAEGKPPVVSSGSRESEERDRTPTLEELSQSTTSEEHTQNLLTQQALSSGDTVPKVGGGRSAESKKAKADSQQDKVSSSPTKSAATASRAKTTSSAKAQKSSKTGKKPLPAATASKATVSSTGSKVKEGEGVSVGGAKESGSGMNVQMQLKMHMARLEELKGHLASKKSSAPQTTTTAAETSTSSSKVTAASNSQPSTSKSAKSVATSKSMKGTKSATTKPSDKPAGSAKGQHSTAKSGTKTASPKKASTASKLVGSSVSKPKLAASAKTAEKKAVAGTSKDSKGVDDKDEGMTCARTMGYVRKTKTAAPLKGGKGKLAAKSSTSSAAKVAGGSGAAKKGGKLTVEAAMSEIGKIVKARKATKKVGGGTSALLGDVQTMSDNLHQLWQSNQEVLLDRVPHPLPVTPSTSGSFLPSHQFTMSLSPPTVSEKFVAGVEKLDKPKKQMTLSLHHSGGGMSSLIQRHTTYHPYSSPLLMFQSYRLNPLYRTNEKLTLHSLSHSNKIDPNRIMCRFELGGICNDPSCTGQHFKDITLDKEELIQDLVCYAPQLAGCSVPKTESEGLTEQQQEEVQLAETKGKIVSYASQMVERYEKKVSDEDLFKLTVHDVNKERAKLRTDPRAKASYISFDDREWLASQKEDDLSSVVSHPLSLLASEPSGDEVAMLEGEGEGESEMEWDSISKELMPLGKQKDLPSSQKCRYFSFADQSSSSPSLGEPPSSDATGSDAKPLKSGGTSSTPSVTEVLRSFSSARTRGEGSEALTKILKDALQHHKTSEDLWIEYLRLQCSRETSLATPTQQQEGGASTTTTSAAKQKEKGQMFLRAMVSTNSYSVGLECLKLAEGYEMKLRCIREIIRLVTKPHPEPHPLPSHQCLELLVNVCVLDELRGRPPADTINAIKALPYYSNVLSILTSEDKQLLSLIYLHMAYSGTVPLCLLATPTSGPTHPARLASKEPFLIDWSKSKQLSTRDYDKLRELFEEGLLLGAPEDIQGNLFTSPEASLVTSCLSLYQNLVLFELAYDDVGVALGLLQHLVSVCPSVPQLWALYARYAFLYRALDEADADWSEVLLMGVHQCPRSAELFHLAARLSLAHQSSSEATPTTPVDSAMQWLGQCVKNFYSIPAEREVDLDLTLVLYRKLLGLMVPYDLQLPEFAKGVAPGNLGNQLASLWLCYCLFVELTLPSSTISSSHSEFHHLSVEDAYESAIHSIHSPPSAVHSLWMEYLLYLRSKALGDEDDFTDFDNFRAFFSAVHRCLIAVDFVKQLPNADPDSGGESSSSSSRGVHEDYSFHDQVVDVFASVLPPTSSFLLTQLQKFHSVQLRNPVLVARLVQCALAQMPIREDLAQTALATYLANNLHCDFLWRMAGALEQRLGRVREARWIYHQAVRASPSCADLWKDFLLLELKEASSSHKISSATSSPSPSLSLISTLLKKSKQSGINLWQSVKDHSSAPPSS